MMLCTLKNDSGWIDTELFFSMDETNVFSNVGQMAISHM